MYKDFHSDYVCHVRLLSSGIYLELLLTGEQIKHAVTLSITRTDFVYTLHILYFTSLKQEGNFQGLTRIYISYRSDVILMLFYYRPHFNGATRGGTLSLPMFNLFMADLSRQ